MARKVQVLLVDDLDGTDLGTEGETVQFSLDGTTYELDLSGENASRFRDELGRYVSHARRAPTAGRRRGAGGHGSSGRSEADRERTRQIREWAVEHGHMKPESRGRIPNAIVTMWEDRNKGEQTTLSSPETDAAIAAGINSVMKRRRGKTTDATSEPDASEGAEQVSPEE